jgi:hypothetical protein
MDDQVGTQVERPLQDGRAEAVVDGDQNAPRVGDGAQGPDIGDFGQRVGRCFEEEQLRFRLDRRFPGGRIGLRNEGGGDAGARSVCSRTD